MNKIIIYGVLLLTLMGCTSTESYVKEVSSSIADTWNGMAKYDKNGYDKEGWNKEKTVHKSGINRNDVLDLKINIARESYTRAGYEIIAVSVNGKKIKDYNKAFSFRIKTGKKYDLIYTVVSPSGSVYDMKKEVYFKNAYDWSKKTMGRGIDDSIYLKVEV